MTFSVLPGPSESIRYTRSGPYDERLGYSRIPEFVERTESRGYAIEAQARPSKMYVALSDLGVFPIYREKDEAGLPYATAIGVSGDTPAALAELLGIIVNGGMRYPHTAIDQLRFAENTPMETVLTRQPKKGQRVLSADIAALVRQELIRVVASGTARRACCGFVMSDGSHRAAGRQDWYRGQPNQEFRFWRTVSRFASGESDGRFCVHHRRSLLRHGDRICSGRRRQELRIHQFASGADLQGLGTDVEAVVGTLKVFDWTG